MAKIINSGSFRSEISKGIVVVDFFATWCGPCKMLAPIFEELSKEMKGKVKFVKVDLDKSMDIARRYNITSVPTVMIFRNGREAERMIGFSPKNIIKSKVEKYI